MFPFLTPTLRSGSGLGIYLSDLLIVLQYIGHPTRINGVDNHAKTVFMANITVYNRIGVTLTFLLLYAVPGLRHMM